MQNAGGFGFTVFAEGESAVTGMFEKIHHAIHLVHEGVVESVKEFTKFDEAMGKLGGVAEVWDRMRFSEEQAADMMDAMKQKALVLGQTTIYGSEQAAEGMKELISAGQTANQAMQTIGPTLNLAAVESMNLGRAALIVADIMNSMKIKAGDSERVVDVLGATAIRTGTNMTELGYAFKYVGPVAATANMSLEQTGAILGAMATHGIKASSAGTALRQVITRLAAPPDPMKSTFWEVMGKMGMTLDDIHTKGGNLKPIIDILGNMAVKMEHLGNAEQAAIGKGIAGMTGMSGFLAAVHEAKFLGIGKAMYEGFKNPAEASGLAFQKMGVSLQTANHTLKPFEQVTRELSEKFLHMSEAERKVNAEMLVGKDRADNLVTQLNEVAHGAAVTGFRMSELEGILSTAKGTIENTAKARLDTLWGDFKLLGVSAQHVGIAFGSIIGPAIGVVVESLRVALNMVTKFFVLVDDLLGGVNKKLGEVKQAVKGTYDAFSVLTAPVTIDINSEAFHDMAIKMGFAGKNTEELKARISETANRLASEKMGLADVSQATAEQRFELQKLAESYNGVATESVLAHSDMKKVADALANNDYGRKQLNDALDKIEFFKNGAHKGLREFAESAAEGWLTFSRSAEIAFEDIDKTLDPHELAIVQQSSWSGLILIVRDIVGTIKQFFSGLVQGIKDNWDTIGPAFTRVFTSIGNIFKAIGRLFSSTMGGITGSAYDTGHTVADAFAVAADVLSRVFEAVATGIEFVINLINAIKVPLLIVAGIFIGIKAGIFLVEMATKAWAIAQGILNAITAANPIILILMAVVALVAAVIAYWDTLKETIILVGMVIVAWYELQARVVILIGEAFAWLGVTIMQYIMEAVENIVAGFLWFVDQVQVGLGFVALGFATVWNWVAENVIVPFLNFFIGVWNDMFAGPIGAVLNFIGNIFQETWNFIGRAIILPFANFFIGIINAISMAFDDFGSAVELTFLNVKKFVLDTITGMANTAIHLLNGIFEGLNYLPGVNIELMSDVNLAEGVDKQIEELHKKTSEPLVKPLEEKDLGIGEWKPVDLKINPVSPEGLSIDTSGINTQSKGFDEIRSGIDLGSKMFKETADSLGQTIKGSAEGLLEPFERIGEQAGKVADAAVKDTEALGKTFGFGGEEAEIGNLPPDAKGLRKSTFISGEKTTEEHKKEEVIPELPEEEGGGKGGKGGGGHGKKMADHLGAIEKQQKKEAERAAKHAEKEAKERERERKRKEKEQHKTEIHLNQNIDGEKSKRLYILDQTLRTFATTV